MKKIYLFVILTIIVLHTFAFETEYDFINPYSEQWQVAGLEGDIPVHDEDISVADSLMISFDIDRTLSNSVGGPYYPSASNIVRLSLPSGEFTLNAPIELRSYVILKGNHQFRRDEDRSQRTILKFDLDDDQNCIQVHGTESSSITTVGIEDLWIIREDDSPSEDTRTGNNIHFRDAENCWVI